MGGAKQHYWSTCTSSITARIVRSSFFPIPRFLANWLLMCSDIVVKNDLPSRGSRWNDALDMTPCGTHPHSPSCTSCCRASLVSWRLNTSNFDVLVKGVFVGQNRTPSIMCHIEAIRRALAGHRYSIASYQGDDVPLPSNSVFSKAPSFPRRGPGFHLQMPSLVCSVKRLGTSASKRYSSLDGECFLIGATGNAGLAPLASTMWRCKMVSGSDFTKGENPSRMDETSSS